MVTMTIWGAGTPRSMRPLWMAEELGLRYQHRPIRPRSGETQSDVYRTLNPKKKIPFLEDGQVALSESLAICRYLRDTYPAPGLFTPTDIRTRAREDELCCHIYGEIDQTGLYVMRRHGDLAAIYGASKAAVTASQSYVEGQLAILAAVLGTEDFLMVTQFGLPDLLLVSCLDWADAYNVPLPQNLRSYRERIALRPAYRHAFRINYPESQGDT